MMAYNLLLAAAGQPGSPCRVETLRHTTLARDCLYVSKIWRHAGRTGILATAMMSRACSSG